MIDSKYFSKIREQVLWPALLKKFGIVISPIRKAGRDTLGVIKCPFHQEKHPSFALFKNGKFHCFGCGVYGDIFNFIQQKLRLSHPSAIMFFNREFNIPLPNGTTPQTLNRPGNWPR
jgi:DNA primase